jgi:myo-inositol 2-dehydrogenase / D-chiro-inositol 1-dehydrogenase
MTAKQIGLAIIGCGTIGRVRAELAREHPSVGWVGVCDIDEDLMNRLADDVGADYRTADFRDLVAQPQVDAVVVATDENWHVDPIMASVEHGHQLFIEKPLATDPIESERVLRAIEESGVSAVVGYTQRFRRRFITSRQRIHEGVIGDVTTVVTRAFMNRIVPIATLARTDKRDNLTPMVVSGTHSLDACLWMLEGLEGKEPVEVYAKSGDKVLGQYGTKDNTLAIFTLADGSLWSMNISWALPETWPGAVYGLEIGVVGTTGVLDIEDTHRDLVVASSEPQGGKIGYSPKGYDLPLPRYVDFLGSKPNGDDTDLGFWGPMREETLTWINGLVTGRPTHHATAADGHRNLLITMAMDKSARTGRPIELVPDPASLLED